MTLAHKPFVDYYYASTPSVKLYLLMKDADTVLAILGQETLTFSYQGRDVAFGIGSNFYTLQPAMGAMLFMNWMRSNPYHMIFGGSDDTHRILRQQNWVYFQGFQRIEYNPRFYASSTDVAWRRMAKSILRAVSHRKVSSYESKVRAQIPSNLEVREESEYTADLLPARSPFTFRFNPSVEYLSWRYNTRLSFTRYRLFRIIVDGSSFGYVIVKDEPHRITVAQCDGSDAATLAWGVLSVVFRACREDRNPRNIMLYTSNQTMKDIFRAAGMIATPSDMRFAIGSISESVDFDPDTSQWLINYDIGDNALRNPFLDGPGS